MTKPHYSASSARQTSVEDLLETETPAVSAHLPSGQARLDFDEQYSKAKNSALRLLTARDRSRHELHQALERREFEPAIITRVVERLQEVGLVDDERFTDAFIRSRTASKKAGPALLRRELRERGVKEELIESALAELDHDQVLTTAMDLARRKLNQSQGKDRQTIKRRIYSVLSRKGYSHDLSMRVMAEVMAEVESPGGD